MTISNERELLPHLNRIAAWRWLFAVEVGAASSTEAAGDLGLSTNEVDWLRSVALKRFFPTISKDLRA